MSVNKLSESTIVSRLCALVEMVFYLSQISNDRFGFNEGTFFLHVVFLINLY